MISASSIRIALAGNPNCGKTTLFNTLTGSNQFVGNWPGVTVEKKEGKLRHHDNVIVTDLPGIYSLSPYTQEEIVARRYLLEERPEVILNIIDGTNLERNLYLTTQLAELGIPLVIAINMMDVVRKQGDVIRCKELSRKLGCPVMEISALKEDGTFAAAEAAIAAARQAPPPPMHNFSGPVEHAIAHIEEAVLHEYPAEMQRWYAIKIFERDRMVLKELQIPDAKFSHLQQDIAAAEAELDDDAEAIITSERYIYIAGVLKGCYLRKNASGVTTSDRIDQVVTNRWLGLPILALAMFLVYYIAMISVGQAATAWANEGLFGKGFHLFGIGTAAHEAKVLSYDRAMKTIAAFAPSVVLEQLKGESPEFDYERAEETLRQLIRTVPLDATVSLGKEEAGMFPGSDGVLWGLDVRKYAPELKRFQFRRPDPSEEGLWIPGLPVLLAQWLEFAHCSPWLKGLILDGIVAGVGAVLGFVPQMMVLFLLLAFLEACGYMSRIAFVLDRLFRKFGLSGKSFIPILVGTGCGVPGIMASRTIENLQDRRMTIITTTFIPCGAKTPFIAMMAGMLFGGSPWIATSAYFIGLASIICSGIILKKSRFFAGEPSPFVMELPAYHMPLPIHLLRIMWDRSWSFVKKAGSIILLSTVLVWFSSHFGFVEGSFRMLEEAELQHSLLAMLGRCFAWLFRPIGWGQWQGAVATLTGLVAKENLVGTLSILYQGGTAGSMGEQLRSAFSPLAGFSFLVYNLLCAPCFAAMSAIAHEMNQARWTAFALGYQTLFAYAVAFVIYQVGMAMSGGENWLGMAVALVVMGVFLWQLFRPSRTEMKSLAATRR